MLFKATVNIGYVLAYLGQWRAAGFPQNRQWRVAIPLALSASYGPINIRFGQLTSSCACPWHLGYPDQARAHGRSCGAGRGGSSLQPGRCADLVNLAPPLPAGGTGYPSSAETASLSPDSMISSGKQNAPCSRLAQAQQGWIRKDRAHGRGWLHGRRWHTVFTGRRCCSCWPKPMARPANPARDVLNEAFMH